MLHALLHRVTRSLIDRTEVDLDAVDAAAVALGDPEPSMRLAALLGLSIVWKELGERAPASVRLGFERLAGPAEPDDLVRRTAGPFLEALARPR